jgi:hypothetical protein
MHEYEALGERYWQGKTEVPGEKKVSQCHFVHQVSHFEMNPGLRRERLVDVKL